MVMLPTGMEVVSFRVTIKLSLPYSDYERVKTLFLTDKHQQIKHLFDIKSILKQKEF